MFNLGSWSSDWPDAIQERSYFMNGICGTGTPRACRTSDTPIVVPTAKAISVTPDGQLHVPEGAQIKGAVPFIKEPKLEDRGWFSAR